MGLGGASREASRQYGVVERRHAATVKDTLHGSIVVQGVTCRKQWGHSRGGCLQGGCRGVLL